MKEKRALAQARIDKQNQAVMQQLLGIKERGSKQIYSKHQVVLKHDISLFKY